jgi:hypothetical protein
MNLGLATRNILRVPIAVRNLVLLDWRRPDDQPSLPPAERQSGPPSPTGIHAWRWGLLGVVLGFIIHPLTLALSYRTEHDPGDSIDLRTLGYIAFGIVIATPVSIVLGTALAWGPRYRPFGLGLVIGAAGGALAGLSLLLVL